MGRVFCTRVVAKRIVAWSRPRPGLPASRASTGSTGCGVIQVAKPSFSQMSSHHCHGDQIAEPLVRHFVRDGVGHALLRADRGGLLVDQQRGLAIDDGAPVLHGAGLEVRHSDLVQLGQRILDAVVVVVVVQDGLRWLPAGSCVRFSLPGTVQTLTFTPSTVIGDALPVANRQRHQIARHLRRSGELDGVLVAGAGRVGDDLAVGDRGVALVDDGGDVEGRLVGRLVEAGEGHARVGRFHLRDFVLAALVGAQIEAAQLVVQMAGVLDVHRRRPGGKLACRR